MDKINLFKTCVTKSDIYEKFFKVLDVPCLFFEDDLETCKANLAFIGGAHCLARLLMESMTDDKITISNEGMSVGDTHTWGGTYERT